jgi:thioredoxin 1
MIGVFDAMGKITTVEGGMNLEQDGLLLVDFCAPWCDVCQVTWTLSEGLAEYYEGRLKLCHVDVDEYPELAARFRVRTVPTLVLLRDAEVVERFVGGDDEGKGMCGGG